MEGTMKVVYLGILLSFFSFGNAEEVLNVETLPTLRTQQYSMGPYKKIIICGPERTGSTLVYNVFKYLFEDNDSLFEDHEIQNWNRLVLKTHILNIPQDPTILCVMTLRNPVDA